MRRGVMTLILAFLLSAALVSAADAKDEFEDGFKTELGAIAARSAVGLGVGVFNGVFGHGVQYEGYYGTPTVFHYGHVRPYYRERVVYAPYPEPYRHVEYRRPYPGPRYHRPVHVHRHYERPYRHQCD